LTYTRKQRMDNKEKQRRFRERKKTAGLIELRGVFCKKEHAALVRLAAKEKIKEVSA